MAKIEMLIPIINRWSGGYVNHPNDKGGPTNRDVTLATYTAYRKKKGFPVTTIEDLKNMTDEEWGDILKPMFWDKWRADEISNQSVANLVVDWYWGSGLYGIKYPQQVLGVAADGIVGPKTLAAINGYPDQSELFKKLWLRRKQHFENIVEKDPTQRVFLKGWMNRLNDFKFSN